MKRNTDAKDFTASKMEFSLKEEKSKACVAQLTPRSLNSFAFSAEWGSDISK